MNNVIIIGRLTRDPEMRSTPSGHSVTKFTIAVDKGMSKEKKQQAEAAGQPTADFISCVAWNKTAELISQYITKGSQIGIQGKIQTSNYEDNDGKRIYRTDVIVDRVKFLGGGQQDQGQQQEQQPKSQKVGISVDDGNWLPNNDDIPF